MSAHVQMPCTDDYCGGTCAACCLGWCKVCGAGESELTTDCPGPQPHSTEEENLELERKRKAVDMGTTDYIDGLGWHVVAEGHRISPRFAKEPTS